MITPSRPEVDRTPGPPFDSAKLRVAIGLFRSLPDALSTTRDLASDGVAPGCITLAASPELVAAASAAGIGSIGWLGFAVGADGFQSLTRDAPAEPRIIADALNDHLHQRALRHQERQLHEHIRNNGWLVLVRLTDSSDQHAVCSSLLRHPCIGVQTHEMRRS